ncbi:MAG: ImmA/IrrE family metallo-endopeptidase [Ignavibacteriae bacterium]|nr:ImmA/IrrE family metallo-endopeptidase [Ignavibacteriota bacterium]
MRTEVNINIDMITWAINRAGLDLSDFMIKFPNIEKWLQAKKSPTVKQLEKFSHKVHLPFGYLFLQEPPEEILPIPFFRTNSADDKKVSVNVYDTILLMQQRQNWLRDYLKDNEYKNLDFVGKFKGKDDYLQIVADIRKTIGLEYEWANSLRTWEEALEYLTSKIEESGIIVVFNGVVENNTQRPIKVEECRGFVLVDDIAPLMFINAADSKAAQLFTIVHELAHIWMGQSAGFDFRQLMPANNPIEILCDKIAAEFLVPEESFNRIWQAKKDIIQTARYFKVSPIVAGRRAMDLGKITKVEFFDFYNDYKKQYQIRKDKQSGGGDFYATTKKRLSMKYAYYINQAVKTNKLLYRDAYKLTGLKGDTYQTFINKHFISI